MASQIRSLARAVLKHRYGVTLFAFLAAAAVTGCGCVLFMRAFEFVLSHRLDAGVIGRWSWLTTPLLFLISVELIRRAAPCADGAGIPQTVFAASRWSQAMHKALFPLVSSRTMAVKIAALLIGLWAGASTGREGPTVHVAACVYVAVLMLIGRVSGLDFDIRSGIIAGGAAGLAAAFNTPLAGVTFAIEELSVDYFAAVKDYVLMAIIMAAVAAKSMTGEYVYFGRLSDPPQLPLWTVIAVGCSCGALGAFFSTVLVAGRKFTLRFKEGPWRYGIPVVLSWGVLLTAALAGPDMLGPGNLAAQRMVQGGYESGGFWFSAAKMSSTLFTYWSGIAGGIFAPCLAIGSAVGSEIGRLSGSALSSCALIGMAAFLSATIQAPITAFVIIFEMTGHHQMLLPIMLASLLAYITARILGAKHLYQALAKNYAYLAGNLGP